MTAGSKPEGGRFEPTVSAGMARAWADLASAHGVNRSTLLAQAGLDPSALQDQDQRVPWANSAANLPMPWHCNPPARTSG